MITKFFLCSSLVVAGVMLSSCDSMRNTFGFDHYQADEMQVNPNPRLAALTIPPNFQLRPPRPGTPNPNQTPADASAKSVLLSEGSGTYEDASSSMAMPVSTKQATKHGMASEAEAHLVNTATLQAGTNDNDNIRHTIDAEAPQKKKSS